MVLLLDFLSLVSEFCADANGACQVHARARMLDLYALRVADSHFKAHFFQRAFAHDLFEFDSVRLMRRIRLGGMLAFDLPGFHRNWGFHGPRIFEAQF
jgi:hypothetical protein